VKAIPICLPPDSHTFKTTAQRLASSTLHWLCLAHCSIILCIFEWADLEGVNWFKSKNKIASVMKA